MTFNHKPLFTTTWTDVSESDPIADMRAFIEQVSKPVTLTPYKHTFYGLGHLERWLKGEAMCASCGMVLDKFGPKIVVCHPLDFWTAAEKALRLGCAVRVDEWVLPGQFFVVDFERFLPPHEG